MNTRQQRVLKIAGICGLLSPIILFFCIALSIHSSDWFSWTENWLSELGGSFGEIPLWSARGTTSVLFNCGLIIAGFGGILFSLAVRKSRLFSTTIGNLGTLVLSGNMFALFGTGLFPVTFGNIHVWSSLSFFCSIPVLLFLMSFEMRRLFGKKWWWTINILCIFSLCSSCAFLFMPHLYGYNKAIAEMVMLCSVFFFCIALSIKVLAASYMHRNEDDPTVSSVSDALKYVG
ncbi:MAG: DUF998 domain-containing protein [Euryarchaeota archaeon]|nr:DUF998 domain-containing protein [Euryarchaeota archaeon]